MNQTPFTLMIEMASGSNSCTEVICRDVMRALGKTLSAEALASLVSHVGPNLHQLHNEVEKLALYVGERPAIAPEDIEAVVTRNKLARAFALGDALGEGLWISGARHLRQRRRARRR